MATFNEKFPLTSRKYTAEQSIVMSNWSKTFQTFRSHSSVFATETLPKNLIFCVFFTSNRPFGGYFQWNACTDFQKICIWIRYSDAKLIKNVWNFWVALLRFCFKKLRKNLNFQSLFTYNRRFRSNFQWKACTNLQIKPNWIRYSGPKLIKNNWNL